MRYVIIGNSYAGISAVEAIRELDQEGRITVISSEPYQTYCRPLITYWIGDVVREEQMHFRPPDWYESKQIETKLGHTVTQVDPAHQRMILDNGEEVAYDRLLIGTGGVPIMPPIAGIDAEGVFPMTRFDDAKAFKAWASDERVETGVIVGAGLICLSVFKALKGLDIKLTMVEMLDRVMGLALDYEASAIVEQNLAEAGLGVRTSCQAEAILKDEQGRVRAVRLKGGEEIPCQAVLMAVGVRPNVDFLKDSGIEINQGIVVDERMCTSIPNIYAAGDVVETWDVLNQKRQVIAILPLACEQGRVAGWNMAGGDLTHPGGIPLNSLPIFDMSLMTMGITVTHERPELDVLIHKENGSYRKLVFQDDRLVGAILIGNVAHGGVLTSLIRSRLTVTYDRQALLKGDPLEFEVTRQLDAIEKNRLWAATSHPALATR